MKLAFKDAQTFEVSLASGGVAKASGEAAGDRSLAASPLAFATPPLASDTSKESLLALRLSYFHIKVKIGEEFLRKPIQHGCKIVADIVWAVRKARADREEEKIKSS